MQVNNNKSSNEVPPNDSSTQPKEDVARTSLPDGIGTLALSDTLGFEPPEIQIPISPPESTPPKDREKTIPDVPSAKKEIVPKIHRKIKTLLQEHEISKWDEVEVFYGLIEKWIGTLIKTNRVFSKMDLLLLGSHHDIVEKNLLKQLKEKREEE